MLADRVADLLGGLARDAGKIDLAVCRARRMEHQGRHAEHPLNRPLRHIDMLDARGRDNGVGLNQPARGDVKLPARPRPAPARPASARKQGRPDASQRNCQRCGPDRQPLPAMRECPARDRHRNRRDDKADDAGQAHHVELTAFERLERNIGE